MESRGADGGHVEIVQRVRHVDMVAAPGEAIGEQNDVARERDNTLPSDQLAPALRAGALALHDLRTETRIGSGELPKIVWRLDGTRTFFRPHSAMSSSSVTKPRSCGHRHQSELCGGADTRSLRHSGSMTLEPVHDTC
jgi:hypothetical protein